MMKCIVTGGGGFIGSHVVEHLLEQGHEVSIIDDFSTNDEARYQEFVDELSFKFNNFKTLHRFSLESSSVDYLTTVFVGMDVVFHLAAHPRVEPSIKDPYLYHKKNVDSTIIVYEAARLAGVKKVVFSSSSSVYGDPLDVPTNETHPFDPMSPYGLHKQIGEEYAKLYSKLYDMSFVCLRYMNVYGPRQPLKGAYVPVVGIWQRQLMNNEKVTITGDGSQTRDFVHVSDVANANILAATNSSDKIKFIAYNVGSGKNYSINEIARWMTTEDNIQYIEERFEPHTTLADLSLVKKNLRWEPKHDLKKYIKDLMSNSDNKESNEQK